MLKTNSTLKSQFHFTNLNISVLTIKNYDKTKSVVPALHSLF